MPHPEESVVSDDELVGFGAHHPHIKIPPQIVRTIVVSRFPDCDAYQVADVCGSDVLTEFVGSHCRAAWVESLRRDFVWAPFAVAPLLPHLGVHHFFQVRLQVFVALFVQEGHVFVSGLVKRRTRDEFCRNSLELAIPAFDLC